MNGSTRNKPLMEKTCNNYQPCVGEKLFHNCEGNVSSYNIKFHYRPNPGMKWSRDHIDSVSLCSFHCNLLRTMDTNGQREKYGKINKLPAVHYEYDMSEAYENLFDLTYQDYSEKICN
jgi:hypothetical protein